MSRSNRSLSSYAGTRLLAVLSGALLALLILAAASLATPISVNLRVEGSSATLFEGSVTTDGETIGTTSSAGSHPCDVKDDGSNGGFGAFAGTPTSALHDVTVAQNLSFDASWSTTYNDFLVSQVGPDSNGGAPEYPSWGYAVNYTTAGVGGCQFQLAPGSEVLWAYNYFNLSHLLSATSPSSVSTGAPIAIHVTDGQTGAPVAGAAIGEDVAGVTTTIPGSALTNAEGNAVVTLTHTGTVKLKATQAESVRSNGLAVCVHSGNDGTCGTTPGIAKGIPNGEPEIVHFTSDVPAVGGVKNGHHYRRHKAPRILRGLVQVPAGGVLRDVLISLQRRNHRRCLVFSGSSVTFVHTHCGVKRFFSVGAAESFSYLLPAALPPGHYVYDIEAIDGSGHPTKPVAGVSHVVFDVK